MRPKKLALAVALAAAGSANAVAMPLLDIVEESIVVSGNSTANPVGFASGPYNNSYMAPATSVSGNSSADTVDGMYADSSSSAAPGGEYRARAVVDSYVFGEPNAGQDAAATASVLFSRKYMNMGTGDLDVDLSFLIDDGRLSVDSFFLDDFLAATVDGPQSAGVGGGFSGTASYDLLIEVELPNQTLTLLDSNVSINGVSITDDQNGIGSGDGQFYSWSEQLREAMFLLGGGDMFTFTAALTVDATGMTDDSCSAPMMMDPGMMNGGEVHYYYGDGCEGQSDAGNGDPLDLNFDGLSVTASPASVPEPTTLALLGISAAAAAGGRRKRRR